MSKIISTKETKQASRLSKKHFALGVLLLVIVLIIVAGAWFVAKNNKQNTAQKGTYQVVADLNVKSHELNARGDYNGALQAYDDAASQVQSADEKQLILLKKASMSAQTQKYDDAMTAARQAESVKPGVAVSQMIAIIAEKMGNKQLAIEYCKKAITQMDSKSPNYRMEVEEMKQKITRLGGTV